MQSLCVLAVYTVRSLMLMSCCSDILFVSLCVRYQANGKQMKVFSSKVILNSLSLWTFESLVKIGQN